MKTSSFVRVAVRFSAFAAHRVLFGFGARVMPAGFPTSTRGVRARKLSVVASLGFIAALALAFAPRGLMAMGTAPDGQPNTPNLAPTLGRVVTNLHDSGPGSLRQTVLDAHDGDIIAFAPDVRGVILLTSGPIAITTRLTLAGPGTDALAVASGTVDETLRVNASSVVLTDLTIRGGSVATPTYVPIGPALSNYGTLALDHLNIEGHYNLASLSSNAALFNAGSLTLAHSRVTMLGQSSAQVRPAIPCPLYSTLQNTGLASVTNSTLSGSPALWNDTGGISTIAGVTAGELWNGDGQMTVVNTTADQVTTGQVQGPCHIGFSGTSTVTHSTLGTFRNAYNGVTNIGSSIIQSEPTYCIAPAISLDYNLSGSASCGMTQTHDLTTGDFLLAPLGDYGGATQSMMPLPGSPAIDRAGDNAGCPATDQRGIARPVDGNGDSIGVCDIGAVEFNLTNSTKLPLIFR